MNELTAIYDNGLSVRTIVDCEIVWFALVDVCNILELSNARMVADRLDEDEVRKFNLRSLEGDTWFVNEPGLYHIVLTSRSEKAKPFRRWVTHEVLPTIRKEGFYSSLSDEQLLELLTNRQKENPKFLYDASLKQQERKELLKLTQNERLVKLWEKRANLDCSQYLWALNEITGGNLSLFNKHFRKYESYLEQKRKYEILTDKVHP